MFPFGILRLLMLVVVITLWSLNLLRWFNNDRNPSWRDGMDRVWTDVQALGFNYCILFGWLAISAVMLFIVFVIHYFPKMKLYPCCMDIYESLQTDDDNQLVEEIEIELESKHTEEEDNQYSDTIKLQDDENEEEQHEQTIELTTEDNTL